MSRSDLNNDGITDEEEMKLYAAKLLAQKNLAVSAMASMVILMLLLLTNWVSIERIDKLNDVLGWFFIAQASVIGAYMGISAYMNRK
jgi:uncharacterized membrane protein